MRGRMSLCQPRISRSLSSGAREQRPDGSIRATLAVARERLRRLWYEYRMNAATKEILRKVTDWPEEDQQELAELAREIEARRTGVYVLSEEERTAIAEARRGAFVSDEDAAAFWQRH